MYCPQYKHFPHVELHSLRNHLIRSFLIVIYEEAEEQRKNMLIDKI